MQSKEYHREYYLKNKSRIDKRAVECTKARLTEDVAYRLHRYAKKRAREANIDCTISLKDVQDIMVDTCPILGILLTSTYGSGQTIRANSNYSLDRIDSSKGYHKDNIQILSYLANIMKNNASVQEQIAFARGILKFYGENS